MTNKFFPLLFLLLTACTQATRLVDDIPLITFDITKESDWTADSIECKFIPLETKDECLLAFIYDVQFYKDRIFVIEGNQQRQVKVFDLNGKFITQISRQGDGPGEYNMPDKLHIDKSKNRITVSDVRLNRLTHYQLDNYRFISSQNTFNNLDCAWLDDGNILWFDGLGFDTGKREQYYIYITNDDLDKVAYFEAVQKSSPYMVAEYSLFQFEGNTYINTPFSPIIYNVSSEKIEPMFKISFGTQTFPPDDYISEIMNAGPSGTDRLLKSDYINSYRMLETSDYLGITFYANGFDSHLGFYNKKTKETHAFSIKKFNERFGIIGGRQMLVRHNDYFIMPLYAKQLKSQQTFREDLNQIRENMTEEDNPVLCLFKFK